jgi:hypothetical protein
VRHLDYCFIFELTVRHLVYCLIFELTVRHLVYCFIFELTVRPLAQRNKNVRLIMVCREAVLWLRQLVADLSPRRPGFAPRSVQWDLWWTKWHWDRFLSEFFGFPLSISFHRGLHFSENSKSSSFIDPFTPSLILIRGRTKGP